MQKAISENPIATDKATNPFRSSSLQAPWIDFLMIGGASLIVFAISYMFVKKSVDIHVVATIAFYLSFVMNFPHFMASYVLLYWDQRRDLLKNKKFLWAALMVPALMIGYMIACVWVPSRHYLSYMVNFMYFTVGWHYIKQIYGTIVVTSVKRGYFFTNAERWALKANLFPVWFMSYFNGNTQIREVLYYGIGYEQMYFPPMLTTINYSVLGISLAWLGWLLYRKWVREGKVPGFLALVSFAAIYVWHLPALYHPIFWYLIPFFHSMQYMLFVTALKKNQYAAEAQTVPGDEDSHKIRAAKYFLAFNLVIVGLGALSFWFVPTTFDRYMPYDREVFGPQLFSFLFITFINIHHYFIDNVLWRRDNPIIKQYLLSPKLS